MKLHSRCWSHVDGKTKVVEASDEAARDGLAIVAGEVIRAVFSPTITLDQLQAILDEAQLKIVSGPTEAGVYSLASSSDLTVRSSLAALRQGFASG